MTEAALVVEARGVTKWFGETTALNGVDMTVPPGVVHGLLGPNGAGKTTLLAALLGLVLEGKATGPLPVPISATRTGADTPSLNAIDDHAYPAFDLYIPDQYRTDIWEQSFQQQEKTGTVPNLSLIQMPDDPAQPAGLVQRARLEGAVPGDKKILAPDQVPGHNLPSDYLGD